MKAVVIDKEIAEEMIARHRDINQAMKDMVDHKIADTMKKLHSELNKQVYEMAEQQGVSIWDICFRYVPQIEYDYGGPQKNASGYRFICTARAKLVPLRMSFDKDYEDDKRIDTTMQRPV